MPVTQLTFIVHVFNLIRKAIQSVPILKSFVDGVYGNLGKWIRKNQMAVLLATANVLMLICGYLGYYLLTDTRNKLNQLHEAHQKALAFNEAWVEHYKKLKAEHTALQESMEVEGQSVQALRAELDGLRRWNEQCGITPAMIQNRQCPVTRRVEPSPVERRRVVTQAPRPRPVAPTPAEPKPNPPAQPSTTEKTSWWRMSRKPPADEKNQ